MTVFGLEEKFIGQSPTAMISMVWSGEKNSSFPRPTQIHTIQNTKDY